MNSGLSPSPKICVYLRNLRETICNLKFEISNLKFEI